MKTPDDLRGPDSNAPAAVWYQIMNKRYAASMFIAIPFDEGFMLYTVPDREPEIFLEEDELADYIKARAEQDRLRSDMIKARERVKAAEVELDLPDNVLGLNLEIDL